MAKVRDRVPSGDSGHLDIVSSRNRGVDLFGSTLEGDDGSGFGEFRLEFGDDEVGCEEKEAESDADTKVLDEGGLRTRERGYEIDDGSLTLHMCDHS